MSRVNRPVPLALLRLAAVPLCLWLLAPAGFA